MSSFSDEDLLACSDEQLERVIREKRKRAEQEEQRRKEEKARINFALIDTILALIEHGRTSCSDTNATNYGRCNRCTLLEFKSMGYWEPEWELEITMSNTKRRQF